MTPDPQPRITVTPGVCSGRPCFAGTRLPIETITTFLRNGDSVEDVLEDYPQITREDIDAALAYEATHPASGEPAPLRDLRGALTALRPGALHDLSAPLEPSGTWFLTLRWPGYALAVRYRGDVGFGLSTEAGIVYGEGAHVTEATYDGALRVATALVLGGTETAGP